MLRARWRHFKSRFSRRASGLTDDNLFVQARQRINAILDQLFLEGGHSIEFKRLNESIEQQKQRADSNDALECLVLLILQAPRAVLAQFEMDAHPHGYHDRQARLFELIDFNDAFDNTVLALPSIYLSTFVEDLKKEIDRVCDTLQTQTFTDRQYEAIAHGLSREIAVYRGALAEGLTVAMTSRREDAFGIDMVIEDPKTGQVMNVDCKTASSYFLRVQDLARKHRLTVEQAQQAEKDGFVQVVNRDDRHEVRVVILRIDSELLGPITNFSFENTAKFGKLLRDALAASV